MNPNWFGIASAVGALIAFGIAYSAFRQADLNVRIRYAVVVGLLAIPGASFALYYTHLLPEPAWYYRFRSWPGTELSLIFVGAAGGIMATLLPRVLLVFPFVIIAVIAAVPFLKPFLGPIPADAFQNRWDGGACRQSTQSTCGPASAATILRHFGAETTETDLAKESYSYIGGTEAWYLARSIRARGCEVRFQTSTGFDPDIPLPAIAGVKVRGIGHFIPILSRNGDVFMIGDPVRGSEGATVGVLLSRYKFTGFYMLISKGGD